MSFIRLSLVLFLVFLSTSVYGYRTGAPSDVCSSITPGHGGSGETIPGGYYLYSDPSSDLIDCGGHYTPSRVYTSKNMDQPFIICTLLLQ